MFHLIQHAQEDLKAATSANKAAEEALKKAEEAEKLTDQVIKDATSAAASANEATAKLQEALDAAEKAAKDAAEFKETATKAIEDVKESSQLVMQQLSESIQKQLQTLIESYQEILNQLKEETEAALKAAQDKLDELYNKIETFVAEQTEKLHDLYGDVEDAIDKSRRATDAANEATIELLKHLAECRKQCELTKEEREKATAAAERAEASADACDNFVAEYQPQMDKVITHVKTLVGKDKNKSVRDIAAEELAKQLIPENADEALNTLEEIAAWIQSHPESASAMNASIEELKRNMSVGEDMINSEVQRSTDKDTEHDRKIEELQTLVNEVVKQGTTALENGNNVIKTLGMNEDGTYKEFSDSYYMKGDDANNNHIVTIAQALLALDAKLHEVASDTTDWSGVLDEAIAALKEELRSDAEGMFSTKVDKASVGVANGVASLDANGKVPAEQVPDIYDDVKCGYIDLRETIVVSPSGGTEENPGYMRFFAKHENGEYQDRIEENDDKLYIDKEHNALYRWTGSAYIPLTTGSTSGDASNEEVAALRNEIAALRAELQTLTQNFFNAEENDVKYTLFGDNRRTIQLSEGDTVSSMGVNLGMVKTYDGLYYEEGNEESGKMPVLELGGTKGAMVLNTCEDRVKVEVVEDGVRKQHSVATLDDFDEVDNTEIENLF